MKKKILSVLLASAMVASLAGCGGKEEAAPAPSEGSTEAPAESEGEAEAPAEGEAEAPAAGGRRSGNSKIIGMGSRRRPVCGKRKLASYHVRTVRSRASQLGYHI